MFTRPIIHPGPETPSTTPSLRRPDLGIVSYVMITAFCLPYLIYILLYAFPETTISTVTECNGTCTVSGTVRSEISPPPSFTDVPTGLIAADMETFNRHSWQKDPYRAIRGKLILTDGTREMSFYNLNYEVEPTALLYPHLVDGARWRGFKEGDIVTIAYHRDGTHYVAESLFSPDGKALWQVKPLSNIGYLLLSLAGLLVLVMMVASRFHFEEQLRFFNTMSGLLMALLTYGVIFVALTILPSILAT